VHQLKGDLVADAEALERVGGPQVMTTEGETFRHWQAPYDNMAGSMNCGSCGSRITSDSEYSCRVCGASLPPNSRAAADELIAAHVPGAEHLTYQEAFQLAMMRDNRAAPAPPIDHGKPETQDTPPGHCPGDPHVRGTPSHRGSGRDEPEEVEVATEAAALHTEGQEVSEREGPEECKWAQAQR
jgi:hypothetical protein